VKKYLPVVTKDIVVYDATSNCRTLDYKQNKNNCYMLALQRDWLVVFLQNIIHYIYAAHHSEWKKSATF